MLPKRELIFSGIPIIIPSTFSLSPDIFMTFLFKSAWFSLLIPINTSSELLYIYVKYPTKIGFSLNVCTPAPHNSFIIVPHSFCKCSIAFVTLCMSFPRISARSSSSKIIVPFGNSCLNLRDTSLTNFPFAKFPNAKPGWNPTNVDVTTVCISTPPALFVLYTDSHGNLFGSSYANIFLIDSLVKPFKSTLAFLTSLSIMSPLFINKSILSLSRFLYVLFNSSIIFFLSSSDNFSHSLFISILQSFLSLHLLSFIFSLRSSSMLFLFFESFSSFSNSLVSTPNALAKTF